MGKNNGPLIGYYANKYGLLLVTLMGQYAGQSRWATNSILWLLERSITVMEKQKI